MTDLYNMITTWATVIIALVAIVALISESMKSRMALMADVMLRVQDKFDSQRMLIIRGRAVQAIQESRRNNTKTSLDAVSDVLDFFEEVALLVRRNVIDKKAAQHAFFHWLDGYWWATIDYIKMNQKKDAALWEDMSWLHHQLVQLENEGKGRPALAEYKMSDAEVQQFLEYEERYVRELKSC